MFVANHLSMIDIMLVLMAVRNPFVFVGKQELEEIPIFNYIYRRAAILVDRESAKSRKNCLLYTSPSPRDRTRSRMPSSA